MPGDFYLSTDQLVSIAGRMGRKFLEGLVSDGGEIACIPSFIPIGKIPRQGRILVLDLGGTNIRCAQVCLDKGRLVIEKGPEKEKLTEEGSRELALNTFLSRLAGLIDSLAPENGLPMGYCFSYPARPTPDGDAVLLRWTKELSVSDMAGRKVGELLCRYLLDRKPPRQIKRVRVINDTVAALMAGMTVSASDACIGLIVGTGTNMAVALDPHRMPKIDAAASGGALLPVNLESGNFDPPYLTRWDHHLDQNSHNPGEQRFEKAVSGQYLARLLKIRMPESDIDSSQSAAVVFEKAYGAKARSDKERDVARQLIERSARLTAASLAGVIARMADWKSFKTVSITAEGSVFWGHPAYRKAAETALRAVLAETAAAAPDFEFLAVNHANLLGSAIAGLCG